MYKNFFKRLFDVSGAVIVLVLTSPILFIACIILAIQNKGSIFFIQERPGFRCHPFKIIKLKTMNDKRDKEGNLLPDRARITAAGKWIRKLSIDELPQLFNVLRGDMSLIGPRPLLFKYVPLYTKEQSRRHEIRPGITGWAQVNGRNAISWQKKFQFDVFYVDHVSFVLDLKIFWKTIIKIAQREGIDQSKARPMEPFNGKN
jgi:undecaprenyl phosphate N,N'-diacetylbacillosamine 1-phosphate transferase